MTEVFLISSKVKLIGAPGLSAKTKKKVRKKELKSEYSTTYTRIVGSTS